MKREAPRTYKEWLATVPAETTDDILWRTEVYRLAVFAGDLAWRDIDRLAKDKRMIGLANQLYRAVGPIGSSVAEGYSRRSGKDQARFYEYALGSAREARGWYYQGRHVLPKSVATHRIDLLTRIIRLRLTIIPAERGHKIRDTIAPYNATTIDPTEEIPMP